MFKKIGSGKIKSKLLMLGIFALALPTAAAASSASFYDVFALQNGGSSKVFLLGHPGATLNPTGKGHFIDFGVKLSGFVPKGGDHGAPVQMTMQLVGPNGTLLESRNANFTYMAPVPEPASLGLMGLGLVGVSWTMMRRSGRSWDGVEQA